MFANEDQSMNIIEEGVERVLTQLVNEIMGQDFPNICEQIATQLVRQARATALLLEMVRNKEKAAMKKVFVCLAGSKQ